MVSPMDVESKLVYHHKRGFNPKSPKSKSPKKSPPKHTRPPPRRFKLKKAGRNKTKKTKKCGGKKTKKARSLGKRKTRRIQYGCKKMIGGQLQPLTHLYRLAEDQLNSSNQAINGISTTGGANEIILSGSSKY